MTDKKQKVLVALSGGVDSAVCAFLLKEQGYDCLGATMRMKDAASCCTDEDVRLAAALAEKLDIPYRVFDFQDDFRACVVQNFIDTYLAGGTPNPCIRCNRLLKFEKLFECGRNEGFDKIATGHYARVRYDEESGRYLLLRALDRQKDQSYVLYTLTQAQLARTVFPLGEMQKSEVRALAEREGFENADRPDSQDLCFVDDGDYASFIERELGRRFEEGDFVDEAGRVLGRHRGAVRYTVGQRKGLGLSLPAPLYVKEKDMKTNRVVLAPESSLYVNTLEAVNINLIACSEIKEPVRLLAKARYRQNEQWATVTQIDHDRIRVVFDEPQRAVTAGQSVVLYDGEVVFGGGEIVAPISN